MPPVTRYQERNPHCYVFSGKPLTDDKNDKPLLPGLWVYLQVPARLAHLYWLKRKDYLMNCAKVGFMPPDDFLPDAVADMRASFRLDPDTILSAIDTTRIMKPGCGRMLQQF